MSKVIEFPTREKRMEKLLREQLPVTLPAEAVEKLAAELREAADRIDLRPKSFNLFFPGTCPQDQMEFISRQVEKIVADLVGVIQNEEGEIFNLIIRYHLLLHETRKILGDE